MQSLNDKVIIITGATAGIGKAIALQAAAKGAKLALCGRTPAKMDALMALMPTDTEVYTRTFDITDERETIAFVSASVDYFGKVDILLNNAGANTAKGNVADIKTSDYEYMIKLNQVAPFVVMREVFNNMRKNNDGRIINILSSVCKFSNVGMGSYTASKDGFEGMTKIFRKEAAEEGVAVTAVYPGGVDTDFREADRSDYLTAETVAESIIAILEINKEAAVHELVLRPHIEKNY